MSDSVSDTGIDRRDFGRVTLGALGVAALAGQNAQAAAQKTGSTIKLCVQSSANPSDEQLLFLKQLGAEYVSVASTPELRTAEGFQQIKGSPFLRWMALSTFCMILLLVMINYGSSAVFQACGRTRRFCNQVFVEQKCTDPSKEFLF